MHIYLFKLHAALHWEKHYRWWIPAGLMKRCRCQIQLWETTAHLKVTINHGPLSPLMCRTRPAGQPQSNKPMHGAQPLTSLHLPAWTRRFIWDCRQTIQYVLLIRFMCDFNWHRHVTYLVSLVNFQSTRSGCHEVAARYISWEYYIKVYCSMVWNNTFLKEVSDIITI